jgi:hypothetical protein
MLVKAILAYTIARSRTVAEVKGYYESAQSWNNIGEFYLEREELENMDLFPDDIRKAILAMKEESDELSFNEMDYIFSVSRQKIHFETKEVGVWKFLFSILEDNSWSNETLNQDERIFTSVDVYEAIMNGLYAGHAAGIVGSDIIEGHDIEDYAWIYLERQEGS